MCIRDSLYPEPHPPRLRPERRGASAGLPSHAGGQPVQCPVGLSVHLPPEMCIRDSIGGGGDHTTLGGQNLGIFGRWDVDARVIVPLAGDGVDASGEEGRQRCVCLLYTSPGIWLADVSLFDSFPVPRRSLSQNGKTAQHQPITI